MAKEKKRQEEERNEVLMANRRKELNLAWRQTNVERKNSIIYSEASKKLANEYDGGRKSKQRLEKKQRKKDRK